MDHPEWRSIVPRKGGPNVLLVVLDTVRAQNMELFGYPRATMPFLARFAREECDYGGKMLANAPCTLPSHASMFTGHFPSSHGAHKLALSDDGDRSRYCYSLDNSKPTLSEWLGAAGYRTAGISANYGVLSGYGLRRGFGYYDCVESDMSIARRICWLWTFRVGGGSWGSALRYRLPDRLTKATVCFTRQRPDYRSGERIWS
ncbi:MAG: sulfatase-like hydrolase/transferase [Candidatus Eisenbacteria sp.]|nr:sulfatase-like hydrolase/transferase [Candidatus Eisenbacteria bacterium]